MKKLWFFFIAIAIVSCKQEVKVDYAILSGKIENTSSSKITLYNSYDTGNKKELTLENGQFTDTVKINNTSKFFLRQGNNSVTIFLAEGDKLDFSYDANKADSTLIFTGENSAISNYLIKKRNNDKKLEIDTKELYSLKEEGFVSHLLEAKTAQADFLYNANGLVENFIKSETSNINYEYLASLSNYESYHRYFSKINDFKVSDKILNQLKDLSFENDEDFKFSANYRNLTTSSYRNKANTLVESDSLTSDIAYIKALATIKSHTIKNKLLFDAAKYGVTYTDDLETYYALYSKTSTSLENDAKITESYHKLKVLAKGNPSPKFTDYENNAGGTTSLDDLKGKYVYMDIWATWCGPCIAEIPFLKKVEKLYHTKNIEFVSISIDKVKDHEKWKKMIIDKELGGMQLFADNNWESQFILDYLIKGIPRFILLDPKGNIISANAPRPSSEKLTELFDEFKI
jgi:thiol-disulfide isomerase/thioredoxin